MTSTEEINFNCIGAIVLEGSFYFSKGLSFALMLYPSIYIKASQETPSALP